MYRRSNGQHELKFEYRSSNVVLEAKRKDFEDRFQAEEQGE